jgi:Holliday junction resolvase
VPARVTGLRLLEPGDVLFRIKRGLTGYVSYLAACEMNQSFSEYVLYEPTLRILTARGYSVSCEYECPGYERVGPGDKKRIDFVANRNDVQFAMEVKWARQNRIGITGDVAKLLAFRRHFPMSSAFLCVFGRKTHIEDLAYLDRTLTERGQAIFAEFKSTKYGCRIFELRESG